MSASSPPPPPPAKTLSEDHAHSPASSFPVSTLSRRKTLLDQGATWDWIVSRFSDRILVVLTSLSKPGTLFQVTQATPNASSSLIPGSSPIYDVQLLLGAETAQLTALAQVIAQLFQSESKPILISLGFKDLDIGTFRTEILPWIRENLH